MASNKSEKQNKRYTSIIDSQFLFYLLMHGIGLGQPRRFFNEFNCRFFLVVNMKWFLKNTFLK